ncbi:MAG: GntR family transcriptional regulator [Christensenellales bacterium]
MNEKQLPAYQKVYNELKRSIQNSEYEVNSLLPSEPVLEKMFGVSRITVRRAIDMLSADGYVTVRQGHGTTVKMPNPTQKLNFITSFFETLSSYGYKVTTKNTHIDKIVAPANVLPSLNLTEGAQVIRFQRLLIANDKPIAIVTNYINADLLPNAEQHMDQFQSLYLFLENVFNLTIDSANDTITARSADLGQSQLLELPIGSPLIYLKRVTYTGPAPLSLDIIYIDGMRYSFTVNLHGRSSESN